MPESLADAIDRCAYCHDQCMAGTPELLATRDQSTAVSRLAVSLRTKRLDDRPWDAGLGERLFLGLNDGLQFEFCIYRREGHRIEPYLRAARQEAIDAGFAPASIEHIRSLVEATGNVFGVVETLADPIAAGAGSAILIHDAASRHLAADGLLAARELLNRFDGRVAELALASCGAVEADLGLAGLARNAAVTMVAALDALPPGPVVAVDATVALALHDSERLLGRPLGRTVVHLSEYLAAHPGPPRPAVLADVSAVYHDSGPLARGLGVVDQPRVLLAAVLGRGLREAVPAGRRASSDGPLAGYPRPDVALAMARTRLAELAQTGADVIVSAGPYSLRNLRGAGPPVPVIDLWSILAAGWSADPGSAVAALLASSGAYVLRD